MTGGVLGGYTSVFKFEGSLRLDASSEIHVWSCIQRDAFFKTEREWEGDTGCWAGWGAALLMGCSITRLINIIRTGLAGWEHGPGRSCSVHSQVLALFTTPRTSVSQSYKSLVGMRSHMHESRCSVSVCVCRLRIESRPTFVKCLSCIEKYRS